MSNDLVTSNFPMMEIESLPELKIELYHCFNMNDAYLYLSKEKLSRTGFIEKYLFLFNERKQREFLHKVQSFRTVKTTSLETKFRRLLQRKTERKLKRGFSFAKYMKSRLRAKDNSVNKFIKLHQYQDITLNEFLFLIKDVPAIDKYIHIIPLDKEMDRLDKILLKEYFDKNEQVNNFVLVFSQKLAQLLYHYNVQVLHDNRLLLYIEFLIDLFCDIDFTDTRSYDDKMKSYIHFLYENCRIMEQSKQPGND